MFFLILEMLRGNALSAFSAGATGGLLGSLPAPSEKLPVGNTPKRGALVDVVV